jgi:predicted amidohydrolase YtcJ
MIRKLETFDSLDTPSPLIVTADLIRTMNADAPEATAMLLLGGAIVSVGDLDTCRRVATERGLSEPEVRTVPGVIVPGFIDAHAHPLMYGQMMSWVDCGPEKASSIPEIVAILKRAAATIPANRPIRGFGYEQRNLAERRHPTRHELDQVATDREVYLMNASGHGGVVNSFALDRAGITRDTPDPEGGEFFRDEAGELTGELQDAACNMLTGIGGVKVGHHGPNFHLADEPEEHLRQLDAAQTEFLRGGVTTIGDAQVSKREFDMYLRFVERGRLAVRVNMYFLSHLLDEITEIGLDGAFGNAHLSVAGIKLYADGSLGGWTAYFPDGYVGDPCRHGQLYHQPDEYDALVLKAHLAGLQTATHAQSPTAIGMAITAIEAAQQQDPRPDARHRIEHCGLPDPEQIERMAAAQIRPVNQTQHLYQWGEGVIDAVGPDGDRFNPLAEFVRAGVPVTLSSDAPVAEPRPLLAIQTAVTRLTRRGNRLGESEGIPAREALAAHTINAAYTLGREDDLGSLEAGKRADFTVLGADPLTVPADTIGAIPVLQTWIDGAVRFEP